MRGHESFHEGRVGNGVYVVTVKQKKERKVEIFGYPKLIKKKY